LTGRTYMRVGSIRTGKIVIYPIIDNVDGNGNQLINWTTEIQTGGEQQNDWNKPGRLDDFIHLYESWRFDWLDVAELIRRADVINIKVEELTGDRPFEKLDAFITQDELRALSDRYKQVAGYSLDQLQNRGGPSSS